jgi:multidrug efflux pump subunit AcrB
VANISLYLTPSQGRKRDVHDIADDLRVQLKSIEGFEILRLDLPRPGPPTGKAIEVAVKGENFDTLNEIAEKVKEFLSGVPGAIDLDISYQDGKKQLRVVVDEEQAKKYLLDVQKISTAVRIAFDGGIATTVKPQKAEEEIDVVVLFDEEHRKKKEDFNHVLIENSRGNLIPLTSVARVEEVDGLYNVQHLDGKRVVYVVGSVDKKLATSQSVNETIQKDFGELGDEYLGYSLSYGGEFEAQKESKQNLMISFLMAFCIIFIILTAMFNSMIQPLIVMLAIPFGMIGVVIAFFFHGEPLSFFSMMGIVGLTGIVVNDSVVLVDFVNKLRKEGHGRKESLIMAGKLRLRPVLMTTITTVGGLISVAYGLGGSDPFLKPMGLSIVWGLTFATVLTLIAIPCIYAIVDDITHVIMHRATVKNLDNEE